MTAYRELSSGENFSIKRNREYNVYTGFKIFSNMANANRIDVGDSGEMKIVFKHAACLKTLTAAGLALILLIL